MTGALFAAALVTTLLRGSDDDVVQRLGVHFETYDLVGTSCQDVFARTPEPGLTTFAFRYEIAGDRWLAPHRYTGNVVFSLGEIVVHLPRTITWPKMNAADRERIAALRQAIEHHEIGHVRIAEAVRDALNSELAIVEPDLFAFGAAAHARGRDGFARFSREEHEYDDRTNHGRRQHTAPAPLGGADSVLTCP